MRPGRHFLFAYAVVAMLCVLFAGCSRGVSGTASPDFAKLPRITKEEQTARKFVNGIMNFDYRDLDKFEAAMANGTSGDLAKSAKPEQVRAVRQLFTTLQAVSSFTVVSSSVLEDSSDHAAITVAGTQVLSINGAQGARTMSTILELTVQKADQTVSSLESLGQDGKPTGGGAFPSMPR